MRQKSERGGRFTTTKKRLELERRKREKREKTGSLLKGAQKSGSFSAIKSRVPPVVDYKRMERLRPSENTVIPSIGSEIPYFPFKVSKIKDLSEIIFPQGL